MEENKESKKVINLTVPVLVILAVAAAFLAGMWVRGGSGKAEEKKEAAVTSPMPTKVAQDVVQGEVLGEEDRSRIETGGAGIKGPESATVTIVEFSEYQCPFCKKYVDDTYSRLFEEYGDQVRYVFHDYPLPMHSHALQMAEAARCAGDQGQYWAMHDLLFENQDEWSAATETADLTTGYAKDLDLDANAFSVCLADGKYSQAVQDDLQLGNNLGVRGTPTFFINGERLVGAVPFDQFKVVIDRELAKE